MLSVVLPSRGRSASLERAVRSLVRGGPVEVLVGLDEDDPDLRQSRDRIDGLPGVRVIVGPRPPCQAVLYNKLAREAANESIVLFCDDYTVDQENWTELAERTMACLPYGYGVGYLKDAMYPFFSTFPMLNKQTIALNTDGDFLPGYYPFLFGDTHWNEIGAMSMLILPSEASVTIQQETGHIHKFSDLKLHSRFFHELRPFRAQIAVDLIRAAFGSDPIADRIIQGMPERSEALERMHATCMTEEFYEKHDNKHGGFRHPAYPAMKTKIEDALSQILAAKEARVGNDQGSTGQASA